MRDMNHTQQAHEDMFLITKRQSWTTDTIAIGPKKVINRMKAAHNSS